MGRAPGARGGPLRLALTRRKAPSRGRADLVDEALCRAMAETAVETLSEVDWAAVGPKASEGGARDLNCVLPKLSAADSNETDVIFSKSFPNHPAPLKGVRAGPPL